MPNYRSGKLYQDTALLTTHEATHLTIFCRTDYNFLNVYLFDRWKCYWIIVFICLSEGKIVVRNYNSSILSLIKLQFLPKRTLIRELGLTRGLACKCYQFISKGLFYNLFHKVLCGHVDPEKKKSTMGDNCF